MGYINKKTRQEIYDKFNGHCAYCGDKLKKGWHVDELEPIVRNYKYNNKKTKFVHDGTCQHPERLNINNQMPSCPSCNINKHSLPLESFRELISGFINSLNRDSTQYKIAKRYGLVTEIEKPVVFHFERVKEGRKIEDRGLILHDVNKAKRTCPNCGSDKIIMFTSDLDICQNCNTQLEGA